MDVSGLNYIDLENVHVYGWIALLLIIIFFLVIALIDWKAGDLKKHISMMTVFFLGFSLVSLLFVNGSFDGPITYSNQKNTEILKEKLRNNNIDVSYDDCIKILLNQNGKRYDLNYVTINPDKNMQLNMEFHRGFFVVENNILMISEKAQ